jgi:hypothetical protein
MPYDLVISELRSLLHSRFVSLRLVVGPLEILMKSQVFIEFSVSLTACEYYLFIVPGYAGFFLSKITVMLRFHFSLLDLFTRTVYATIFSIEPLHCNPTSS